MTKSKILFLTTASIATNPRLLKSYLYWKKQGHVCKIMAFRMHNWSDALDDDLIKKYNLDILSIPAGKQNYFFWLQTSLWNRFLAFLPSRMLSMRFLAYASNKRTWQLMQNLKKNRFVFDHIEAHTLGALYPAYYWSKKKNKTFSFDVEDFHPEEKISFQKEKEKARRYFLMKNLLPFAIYITAASPLIALETEKLVNKSVVTINNSFFEEEFKKPDIPSIQKKIRLVWFSITISYGRGLEELIKACQEFRTKIELQLIGNIDIAFNKEYISPNLDFIVINPPISQTELHEQLNSYDVGLAIEMASTDFNRNICLTNKLFAYAQSGLFVLATDTLAQEDFLRKNSTLGQVCQQSEESIGIALNDIYNNLESIRTEKVNRYEQAKLLSFEEEMKKIHLP